MRAFVGGEENYVASVSLDASTIGDVTTAVGVFATRHDEVEILESILRLARERDVEFVPFKSKSNYYDKRTNREFFERVIESNEHRISSCHFRHHSATKNQHYVEAVLCAILIGDIVSEVEQPLFIIVDGDENKVEDLATAYAGIGTASRPPLSNCYQAELYYPHALLADLTAGYLAEQLDSREYDYADPLLRSPAADRVRSDAWGRSFNCLRTKRQPTYHRAEIGSLYGETERERARIWYSGLMGRRPEDSSPSVTLDYLTTDLRNEGYTLVADRLMEL